MHLAIDVRTLYNFRNRGLGAAQMTFLEGLRKNGADNKYQLLIDDYNYKNRTEELIKEFHSNYLKVLQDPRFEIKIVPEYSHIISSYEQTWEQLRMARSFQLPDDSIYVGFSFIAPIFRKFPVALYVPDTFIKVLPQHHNLEEKRIHMWTDLCIKKADIILTCSGNSKKDIHYYYGIPPERIHVVYDNIDDDFQPMKPEEARNILEDIGLPEKYILCVGVVEPRKNLANAVRGFKRYLEQADNGESLILCGSIAQVNGKLYTDVSDEIQRLGLRDRVVVLDYVREELLKPLYAAADLFLFTSLYEGFGRPPIEANRIGVPVVASWLSCIPEVTAGAAEYVDPYDPDDIARGIKEVLHDKKLQKELVQRGFSVANRYTMEKRTNRILEVLGRFSKQKSGRA